MSWLVPSGRCDPSPLFYTIHRCWLTAFDLFILFTLALPYHLMRFSTCFLRPFPHHETDSNSLSLVLPSSPSYSSILLYNIIMDCSPWVNKVRSSMPKEQCEESDRSQVPGIAVHVLRCILPLMIEHEHSKSCSDAPGTTVIPQLLSTLVQWLIAMEKFGVLYFAISASSLSTCTTTVSQVNPSEQNATSTLK